MSWSRQREKGDLGAEEGIVNSYSVTLSSVLLGLLVIIAPGCGVEEQTLEPLGTFEKGDGQIEDSTLGLTKSAQTEYWDMSSESGSPAIYRPSNFDTAMSAFARISFDSTNQVCSGMKVYEQKSGSSYDVFLMTARHCLLKLSPFGQILSGGAGTTHSFKVTSFAPRILRHRYFDNRICKSTASNCFVSYRDRFFDQEISESFTGKTPLVLSSALVKNGVRSSVPLDVVKFLLKSGVTLETASREALPLCAAGSRPEPVNLRDKRQEKAFMMIGYDSALKRVVLERMHGEHNYSGPKIGSFTVSQELKNLLPLLNVDEQGRALESSRLMVYRNNKGTGAESSDSGAPVLVGQLHDSAKFFQETGFKAGWVGNDYVLNQKIHSIDCVSGFLSREFSTDFLKISRRTGTSLIQGGGNLTLFSGIDISLLGFETSNLIQLVEREDGWQQ